MPLTAKQLTSRAISCGYLNSRGKTPWHTMKSKLSSDILKNERSPFMRSGPGHFALRSWRPGVSEYIAERFRQALFDEDILVFPANSLSNYVPSPGLHQASEPGGLQTECRPMRRREAEHDNSVIQLVSVFVIRYQGLLLTHKRTRRLPEARLHGYYSLSFGGHLNPDDLVPLFNIFDPDFAFPWLYRELDEEVRLERGAIDHITFLGLLYDDSAEVSRQHLGLAYQIDVHTPGFEIGERGFLVDAKFESFHEIRARKEDFENWSLLLLQELTHD